MQAQTPPMYKDLYVSSIGFFPYAKFHYCERKNGSPQSILIYCIKGSGQIEIDGVRVTLNPNQLLILPKIHLTYTTLHLQILGLSIGHSLMAYLAMTTFN